MHECGGLSLQILLLRHPTGSPRGSSAVALHYFCMGLLTKTECYEVEQRYKMVPLLVLTYVTYDTGAVSLQISRSLDLPQKAFHPSTTR